MKEYIEKAVALEALSKSGVTCNMRAHKIVASIQADVIKAKKTAVDEAVKLAWTILFSVLWDKEHYTPEDMQRVWKEVDSLSDSIVKGYCNVSDLRTVLREEAGVDIE